ncbi:MAG: hypothetical protein HN791_13200 [Gammaproteobacteria bacterium]|jgi:hypothetical protein|nr:hypothetical protein [Gammaproteobacteria bacterium]
MDRDHRTHIIEQAKQEALRLAKAASMSDENTKQPNEPFINNVIERVLEMQGVKGQAADKVRAAVLAGLQKPKVRDLSKPASIPVNMYIPESLKIKIDKLVLHISEGKIEYLKSKGDYVDVDGITDLRVKRAEKDMRNAIINDLLSHE